jgi:hypothetical protein
MDSLMLLVCAICSLLLAELTMVVVAMSPKVSIHVLDEAGMRILPVEVMNLGMVHSFHLVVRHFFDSPTRRSDRDWTS